MWSPIMSLNEDKDLVKEFTDRIYNVLIEEISPFNVYMGRGGIYLYLLFYKLSNKENIENLDEILEAITNSASLYKIENYQQLTFYAEIGWLICFLYDKKNIDLDLNAYLGDIDESLYESMIFLLSKNEYGLVNGAISIGQYFHYRYILGHESSLKSLEVFVEYLSKISNEKERSMDWISIVDYGLLKKGNNLGIAHGMPGIILFLEKLYKLNIRKKMIENILIKTTNFLLSQKHSLATHKSYFYDVNSEAPQTGRDSRLAWCYGDLSVGYSLYKVSRIEGMERPAVEHEALDILMNTVTRTDLKEISVVDGGLCHGTSGLAHIYNRLYQDSKIDIFKDAALFWYKETFKMSKYNNEFVGFGIPYYLSEKEKEINREYNTSFLTGIAGIGLSLLSAIYDVEPEWDNYLLLS